MRFLLILFLAFPLLLDEPLPPPETHTIYSLGKQFRAVIDAEHNTTSVYRAGDDPGERLWHIQGWHRVAALSPDGRHLVTGYDGMNLIPLTYRKDMVMLTFYTEGVKIREVRLHELIDAWDKLQRTVSHYYWGNYLGFDDAGRYRLQTVEGKILVFDPKTGNQAAQ